MLGGSSVPCVAAVARHLRRAAARRFHRVLCCNRFYSKTLAGVLVWQPLIPGVRDRQRGLLRVKAGLGSAVSY
jgi:hypothetical protein